MANAGMRGGEGTNGSQFFITFIPIPLLDGHGKDCEATRTSCHTVFGRVIQGMDIVNGFSRRDPSGNPLAPPGDAMKTIRIVEE